MKTLLTIARKEIHESLLSARFVLLLILALTLIPASLDTNYRAYETRKADQMEMQRRSMEQLRGLAAAQLFTNPDLRVDVYLPPVPSSAFATGFQEAHPRHILVGRHGVEYGAPLEVSPSLGLFGGIDYLFVVQLLFSLFAVLLSFDAVTREKEAGTLRSILANPVRRSTLAAGKFVGGFTMLALPLVIAFVAGLLVVALAGLDLTADGFLVRSVWILASSLLYVAVFFLMGLLISALTRSTYAALVVSLAVWLVAVLVLPRSALLVARLVRPVESRQAVLLEKTAALADVERAKGRALQEIYERAPETWEESRDEVVAPFDRRADATARRIDEQHRLRVDAQRSLALAVARLSPTGSLVSFVTEMAGTGLSAERRFLADAETYQETLRQELFAKVFMDNLPGGTIRMGADPSLDLRALPEFRDHPPGPRQSLRIADLAILAGWSLVLAFAAFTALARYDVR
ncbi:MAG: ABC transporter permease subunit [Acidobacteriota bacterium]|jgi:ABC-type transport system involved in multi-copper enzyme maturation permease subunit